MSSATRREPTPLPFRRCAISPRVISKGRRAKRGRRRDYKDVFLHCGILTEREATALDALKSIRGESAPLQQTYRTFPSAKEGLKQCVERFVEFVGCAANEAPVEFWIPQVANALALNESTLSFVVHVLVAFQVLVKREGGTFLWRGTNADCSDLMQIDGGNVDTSVETSNLSQFCLTLLDTLKHLSKEPIPLERLCEEMMRKVQNDHSQIDCQVESVCCVLLGAGILHEIKCGSELCYSLQPPSKPSVDLEQSSLERSSVCSLPHQDQASQNSVRKWTVGIPLSLSVALNDMSSKKTLESLIQRVNSAGSVLYRDKSVNTPIQAAVMEIARTGIRQVGVADILGHGALASLNNEWTNPVIALAVPQWMLTNKQSAHQIHAYEVVGLENGLASNKQPLFMSYVPVTHGTLTELLGKAVHGHRALMVNAEALQHSSSVLKQF